MFHHAKQGAVDVVGCDGPIDASSASQFEVFARERVASGQPRLVIDLANVPIVDSKGLEAILDLQDNCLPRGGMTRISSPTPLVREILDVTEVSAAVEVFEDLAQAVGSFAQ